MTFLRTLQSLAFILVANFPICARASNKAALRFAVTDTYGAPTFVVDEKGRMSGIYVDIIQYISKNLNVDYNIVIYPRPRIDKALSDGEIDLICISNPKWTKAPDQFNWSQPLYEYSDYIVRNSKAPPLKSINDLKNRSVGVIRGYSYSKVGPLFRNKQAERSDFFDSEGLFTRLKLGQIQYGILSGIFLEHMGVDLNAKDDLKSKSKESNSKSLVQATGMIDAVYKIYCRTSKKGRIDIKELNAAIKGFQLKTQVKKQSG